MSIVTKLFVVLHVVLTLILVPALIVYVNKTEDFTKQVATAQDTAKRAAEAQLRAEQEAIAARGDRDLRVLEAAARGNFLVAEASAAQKEAASAKAEIAGYKAAAENEKIRSASAEEATKAVLKTVAEQEAARRQIAAELAEAQKTYWQLNTRFNVLVTERDGAMARNRRLQEDVKFLEDKINQMTRGGVAQASGTQAAPGMAVSTPLSLRGVVTSVQTINGVAYATISLGSADSVVKGLKFKVHDRNNFLGYLTVDSVEPKESVGRLMGPSIAQIRAGTEVTTQN